MIPGITCRCWLVNPALCVTALPSKTGCCGGDRTCTAQAAGADDGNRQMVDILKAVLTDGLPAVEAACARQLPTASIPPRSFSISWPASVILRRQPTSLPCGADIAPCPIADCARYDNLRKNELTERTQLFDLMGKLKLYSMKAAISKCSRIRKIDSRSSLRGLFTDDYFFDPQSSNGSAHSMRTPKRRLVGTRKPIEQSGTSA
jgi:hypothetical protein